jgi:hypothetical protein
MYEWHHQHWKIFKNAFKRTQTEGNTANAKAFLEMSDWWLLIRILNLLPLNFSSVPSYIEMEMTSKYLKWEKAQKMKFRAAWSFLRLNRGRNWLKRNNHTSEKIFSTFHPFFAFVRRKLFDFPPLALLLICNLWSMEAEGISITGKIYLFSWKNFSLFPFVCLVVEESFSPCGILLILERTIWGFRLLLRSLR